ncbi:hypothetical protein DPMN_065390 [Dreissena polymorpha]|uniref:Uncharacterized protein n=1 Tax=Dreissena polymorpha TaxID=45954 RepID=A0A9D3YVU2_DREPO|nr:hypothetical protein DPMN_065390 [Dreissena polymorpha]
MDDLQNMADMLNKRLSQFMGTAETSQPRYGSRRHGTTVLYLRLKVSREKEVF